MSGKKSFSNVSNVHGNQSTAQERMFVFLRMDRDMMTSLTTLTYTVAFFSLCLIARTTTFFLPVITVFNLLVIAIERYLGIFYPLYLPSRKAVRWSIILAWVIGFLVAFIPGVTYTLLRAEIGDKYYTHFCVYNKTISYHKYLFWIFSLCSYILPSIVFFVITYRISRFLSKRPRGANGVSTTNKSDAWRFKSSRMFLSVIMFFSVPYLSWYLYTLTMTTFKPNIDSQIDVVLRYMFTQVILANGIVNPILYFYHTREFRVMLKKMLTFIKDRVAPST
ncbi:predicted protein [Nematostella vectensis]|uniref:G-protein coupled receptors family 1 profile domain-containing protein n=1 Tax=Nematostella vectensis TaxID=45351 RepID=A7S0G6_NEMVE|nr:predicted protein [Nematostella vectensis]|eukprot:XP_001634897.1 predicted protein [Nematostella vectensis]